MLETRIQGALSVHDNNQDARPSVEDLIKQCLSQLYVIRCSSSSQFLITLHSLETLLSNNPNICILMIDSISAFYWIDRSTGGSTGYSRTNNKLVVEALRKLLLTYNLVVFCAKAELFEQRTYTDNGPSERGGQDMMGQHWHRLVTHRWTLGKTRPIRDHASGVLRNCYSVTGHDAQKTKSFQITEKGVKFMKWRDLQNIFMSICSFVLCRQKCHLVKKLPVQSVWNPDVKLISLGYEVYIGFV